MGSSRVKFTEGFKPIAHCDDTRDGTGVVPKEDTAKGGEGDHADADDIASLRTSTDAWAGCGRTTWHCERAMGVSWGEGERRGRGRRCGGEVVDAG